jgi:hypothetical protein
MPSFFKAISDRFTTKNAERVNHFQGFTENGEVVLPDSRGTRKPSGKDGLKCSCSSHAAS